MTEFGLLIITAATVGVVHTILGPNHYLPLIVMSRSRNWSHMKTCLITAYCGLGHVLGSMIIGLIWIGSGLALSRLHVFNSFRSSTAAWVLIAFGLIYCIYGLRQALCRRPHCSHHHQSDASPWILFSIFLLCPCEPLIPLLIYPAATIGLAGVAAVSIVFGIASTITMLSIVLLTSSGLGKLRLPAVEPYAHSIAGAAVSVCGLLILFHH